MTIEHYSHTVAARFLRYVQIDTQSDPDSTAQPSTEKQKDLSRLLVEELQQMGITDAELDAYGYVYATLPATSEKNVPVFVPVRPCRYRTGLQRQQCQTAGA